MKSNFLIPHYLKHRKTITHQKFPVTGTLLWLEYFFPKTKKLKYIFNQFVKFAQKMGVIPCFLKLATGVIFWLANIVLGAEVVL